MPGTDEEEGDPAIPPPEAEDDNNHGEDIAEDTAEDTEDSDEEEEEAVEPIRRRRTSNNNIMTPPGRAARSPAGRGRGRAGTGSTTPRTRTPRAAVAPPDPVNNLAAEMNGMSIGSFQKFSPNIHLPFRICVTGFIEGVKVVVVDVLVPSYSEDKFLTTLSDDGLEVTLKVNLPPPFLNARRTIQEEYSIQGGRDAILSAFDETADWVVQHFGVPPISSQGQTIRLPFKCEQCFSCKLIWTEGDEILANEFHADRLPIQL